MKSSATPRVTKITGQPIENNFLTSSFFSRGDLIGGIVPRHTQRLVTATQNTQQYSTCIAFIIRSNIYHSSKTECQRKESPTHFHHSPVLQTGSSGCHSRRCYRLSSSARTRWPHAALPGTHLWWRWCVHSATPMYLQVHIHTLILIAFRILIGFHEKEKES